MKEKNTLHLGDIVLWRGFPPQVPTQTARVTGIERDTDDFSHNGVDVASLPWKRVKDATIVFDNGHWDYGYNLRRLKTPKAWQSEATATHRDQNIMPSEEHPHRTEQAAEANVAGDLQHIAFLQGLLEYEWETTPDDSEDRRTFLHAIEQAQAWLQGLEHAHKEHTTQA